MVCNGEKIVEGISNDPGGWAISLFSKGFISDTLMEETIELNETNASKAQKLYSTLLKKVKAYPEKLDEFISLLQEKGSCYDDLKIILSRKPGGE